MRKSSEVYDFYAKEAAKRTPLWTRKLSIERQQVFSKFVPSNTLLLDVGCGDGSFSQLLGVVKYVGIDINRQVIKRAKSRSVDVVLASCDCLPFKNEVFDICSMIEVIEHLFFPEKTVRETHRVLKRSGKLLLATPNFVNFIDRINVLIGTHPIAGTEHLHIRFFTWKTLNLLLLRCGFKLERRENWFISFPTRTIAIKYDLWRKIMRNIAKLFPNLDEGLFGIWRKI
jgi:SAM-dependent methyltransferase